MIKYYHFLLATVLSIGFSSCGDESKKTEEELNNLKEDEQREVVVEEKNVDSLYLFHDFYPNAKSDFAKNVFASNGEEFYLATYKNSEQKSELWICDGTTEGLKKIASFGWIESMPLDGYDSDYAFATNYDTAITKEHFYFLAGKHRSDVNLYMTSGKPGDTIRLKEGLRKTNMYVNNEKVYFIARDDETKLPELYEADGSQLTQITENAGGTNILKIVGDGDSIFFVRNDDTNIYTWNGESLKKLFGGLSNKGIKVFRDGIEVAGDYIYFYAFEERSPNRIGFYAGNISTGEFKNLLNHPSGVNYDSDRPHIYAFNNKVYFAAPGPEANNDNFTSKIIKEIYIWEANGFSEPKPIQSLKGDKEYSPFVALEFSDHIDNKLLIDKYSNPDASGSNDGDILYSLDSKSGRMIILDTLRQDFEHYYKSKTSNYLYFKGWKVGDHDRPQQLWRTNGTVEGTTNLESSSNYKFSDKTGIAVIGSRVFFIANGDSGTDLWIFEESIN